MTVADFGATRPEDHRPRETPMGGDVEAVVFDFDGTILDTETPVYEAWRDTFALYGAEPISFEDWVASIGLSARPFDPVELLEHRLGRRVDRAEVQDARRVRRDAAINQLPLRAGVEIWLEHASALGVRLAIASSSPRDWVEPHLTARGLRHHFEFIACAGDPFPDRSGTVPGKPDPSSYSLACRAMGVSQERALAVEDSPHGVTAANRAGLTSIAVPGPMTAHFDYSHAHVVLDSLEARTLHSFLGAKFAGG